MHVAGRLPQRLPQVRRPGRQDVDPLVQVPVRRGLPQPEPGAQPPDISLVPEPGQHEQRLLIAAQLAGTFPGAPRLAGDPALIRVSARASRYRPDGRFTLLGNLNEADALIECLQFRVPGDLADCLGSFKRQQGGTQCAIMQTGLTSRCHVLHGDEVSGVV